MKRYIISGFGFVGRATLLTLEKFHSGPSEITIDDPFLGRMSDQWHRADYHVICVPTPTTVDGNLDTSAIDDAIARAKAGKFGGRTVIRSTINPLDYDGLIRRHFKVPLVWPEFLREAHWREDALDPRLVVMGGPGAESLAANFNDQLDITLVEDPRAACMMKVARNAFYALKVIASNDLATACAKLNVDYAGVKSALMADPMIGPSHWDQPGHDGSMGYGGKCLPKDTASLSKMMSDLGLDDSFAAWAQSRNSKLR